MLRPSDDVGVDAGVELREVLVEYDMAVMSLARSTGDAVAGRIRVVVGVWCLNFCFLHGRSSSRDVVVLAFGLRATLG